MAETSFYGLVEAAQGFLKEKLYSWK
jgi:hypothetical protein